MSRVVVLNTGFSSLKFAVFPLDPEAPPLVSGSVEGIGGSSRLKTFADGRITPDAALTAANPHAAMEAVAALRDSPLSAEPTAFGHQFVHGGPDLDRSVIVDGPTLVRIEAV